MPFEIGKVIEYDGFKGMILTPNDKYMFLNEDINHDLSKEVSIGDIVRFRGEEVQNVKKAYFVEKLPYNNEINKKYVKENR